MGSRYSVSMAPELEEKLDNLPVSPGVYLFKDKAGGVLYVGKARSLRSRVRSYFQESNSDTRAFISRLSRELGDIETVVVGTEKEAALLENTLIKQHRPKYNVKLRDDKEYLSLRLDPKGAWPRLEVVRKPKNDGALYFGPYHSATSARQTLRLVNRHFQLRTCTDTDFESRRRPCLQYQIKRCLGPCVFEIDRALYGEQVQDVGMFLDGRHDELIPLLEGRMREAAVALDFERAAEHRDQLRAIERVREKNRVAVASSVDQDVFGLFRRADQAEVAVLQVRAGKLTNVRTFGLKDVSAPDDEICAQFALEYYVPGSFVPQELLLPVEIEAMDGLAELLAELRGKSVKVLAPKKGPRAELVQMARDNASHAYREKARSKEDVEARLLTMQEKLRLPRLPRRIECVDVSHTGGTETVASIVALCDAQPDRKRYKSFHVKRVSGGDDYSAMYEVLSRRFRRGRNQDKGWEFPDLLVVDGGRGQLNVAQQALIDLGITDLPIAALAKEKPNALGEKLVDRVYLPGQKNPIEVRENAAALSLLALARDEAHRTSNALRLKLNKRSRIRSRLDEVQGIGPKTRTRLLTAFGSVRAIEEADEVALRGAGATQAQALAILRSFHGPLLPSEATRASEPPRGERAEQVLGPTAATHGDELRELHGEDEESAEEAAVEHAFDEGSDYPDEGAPSDELEGSASVEQLAADQVGPGTLGELEP
jgi:excinuclease ABC subunit C